MDTPLTLIAYFGGLLALAAALAALLRACRTPGWPILGGVLAGIILGPTILGRIAPNFYEQTILGSVEQRTEMDELLSRQHAEQLAALEVGADEDARRELEQRHRTERLAAQRALDDARWTHQLPQRIAMATVVALVLLGSNRHVQKSSAVGRGLSAVSNDGRAESREPSAESPIWTFTNIGLWAALLPGSLAGLCMFRWWGYTLAESLLVAAAVMIGPWILTQVDREAADQAELGGARLIQRAGRIASIAALVTIAIGALFAEHPERLLWTLPLLALAVSWLLPMPDHRCICGALNWILLPLLGAICAARIELIEHFAFWPLLIMLVLSGDGRWIGAAIGTMLLGGRRLLRTMRLVMGAIACGPTQLAVLVVLMYAWSVPEELPLALLVGAVLIEVSVPARRSLARRLSETEQTMREFDDEA